MASMPTTFYGLGPFLSIFAGYPYTLSVRRTRFPSSLGDLEVLGLSFHLSGQSWGNIDD